MAGAVGERRQAAPAPRHANRPLRTLDDGEAGNPAISGRKAATLARLRRAGYPVPSGLVIPVIDTAAEPTAGRRADSAGLAADLARRFGGRPLAVRSSSPAEDGALSSAAGRFQTVLNVPPHEPDMSAAVHRVLDSAGGAQMAVLIQPMIAATAAGVAFGADPVTGERDVVRVSAVRGLADRLVGGAADADQWLVRGGAVHHEHAADSLLTERQVVDIARLVTDLGLHEGAPQDVEWAIDPDGLHLVQCRPITALPTPPAVDLPPGTWVCDRNRYPNGMTPFGMSLAAEGVSRGLTEVFTRCGALVERVQMRDIAGHPYLRFVPVGGRSGPPPPAPVLGLLARAVPALRRRCRIARQLLASGELAADIDRWNAEGRAQARESVDALGAVDPAGLSDADLADHLEQVLETVRRGLRIHFRLMAAHTIGVHRLITACAEMLGWTAFDALALLTGTSVASDEPTRRLHHIAERIAADPQALAAVTGPDGVPALRSARPRLGQDFETWCGRYGLRTANDDPGSPTLGEIPGLLDGLLLESVRKAARSTGTGDSDAATGGRGGPDILRPGTRGGAPVDADRAPSVGPDRDERDGAGGDEQSAAKTTERARAILARRPADLRRFEAALAFARRAYPIREDNVLWALSMPTGLARRAVLRIGARLQGAGHIDDPRDVVMLPADTVLSAIRNGAPGGALRRAVATAKAERAWVAAHPLPDFYGPPPAPMPDLRYLPPPARIVNEALQLDRPTAAPARPADPDTLLAGVAGSPGRHTGTVRIVRTPDDFARLRQGEVLVCAVTDPAWSVLFGVAGAVVADGGGVLTHSAIIAREHGIPAVLATGSATTDLVDGQLVTVDGSAGRVLAAAFAHP